MAAPEHDIARRALLAEISARARANRSGRARARPRRPKPNKFPSAARNAYLQVLLDIVDRTQKTILRIVEPMLPALVAQASRARADADDPPQPARARLAIVGSPRAGKTTAAKRLAELLGLPVTHSDDLIGLGWSEASSELARRIAEAPSGIFEGVAVVRAIRKLLEQSTDRPVDTLLILRQALEPLSEGQRRMARAQDTILYEIVPRLHARGVRIAHEAAELEPPPPAPQRADAAEDDLDAALEEAAAAVERDIRASVGVITQQTGTRVQAHTKKETQDQVGTVLGIDVFSPETGMPEIAHKFVEQQQALIKGLVGKQLEDAKQVLAKGLREGWRPESLARALTDTGQSEARATILANDSVAKLHGTMTMERQLALGIKEYTWTTAHDEKVRPGHKALDGTVQKWSQPPITNPKTGKRAHPGFDTNYYPCRCSALPRLEGILDELEPPRQQPPAAPPKRRPPQPPPIPQPIPQPPAAPPKPKPRPRQPAPPPVGPQAQPPARPQPQLPPRPPAPPQLPEAPRPPPQVNKRLASELEAGLQRLPDAGGDATQMRDAMRRHLKALNMVQQGAATSSDLQVADVLHGKPDYQGLSYEHGAMKLRTDIVRDMRAALAAIGRGEELSHDQAIALRVYAHEELHRFGPVPVNLDSTVPGTPAFLIEETTTEVAARAITRDMIGGGDLPRGHALAMPHGGEAAVAGRAYDHEIRGMVDGLRAVTGWDEATAQRAFEAAALEYKRSFGKLTSKDSLISRFVNSVPGMTPEQRRKLADTISAIGPTP